MNGMNDGIMCKDYRNAMLTELEHLPHAII
jgi:hypothetical protein